MKREDNQQVNQGFSQQDIQILTEEDYEEEDKEVRRYWCAICKSRLDYLEGTETIWMCSNCSQMYDTSIQDVPVKDISESKVRTYTELDHYPTYEEDDMFTPFIEGINPDREEDYDQEGVELVSPSYDNRMQHIRVKGDITKALSAQHNFE
jgi:ribosomal protein L37AE/L43A